jgi:putative ABC transport system permease protein
MTLLDMVGLALDNLRRTKLRTGLTTLGVVIGIGALASMVSFGTGMQRNITDTFEQNDLFTTMFVTAKGVSLEDIGSGDPDVVMDAMRAQAPGLTDSTLKALMAVPGVEIAFPEVSFPVKIRMGERETRTTLRALPASMGGFKPYNQLAFGEFFADDSASSVVLSWDTLKRMKMLVSDPKHPAAADPQDSTSEMDIVEADSILGAPIDVISVVLDPSKLGGGGMMGLLGLGRMPTSESVSTFTVGGIIKRSSAFSEGQIQGGIIVPMKTAEAIPSLGFSNVWDLLGGGKPGTYSSIYVRVERPADLTPAREAIEKTGLHVFSIADELKEIRRGFLVVDSILGAIGTIALIVAALGIANTMVMSILERTREIGIMKAIGASEGEIKMIFFVEAAVIGAVGGVFGLLLGYGVTRIANLVVNLRLLPEGEAAVSLFYFPSWLILGALGFSVLVSLIAGLYPAVRAAGIDPVNALRHD